MQKLQEQYFYIVKKVHNTIQFKYSFVKPGLQYKFKKNKSGPPKITAFIDENEMIIMKNLIDRAPAILDQAVIVCLPVHGAGSESAHLRSRVIAFK